jgi:uncharacterized protein (DUF3820 family)
VLRKVLANYVKGFKVTNELRVEKNKRKKGKSESFFEVKTVTVRSQIMKKGKYKSRSIVDKARPVLNQHTREIQPYGTVVKLPIALSEKVCAKSIENLNQVLADTMTLRYLYKKHHWQVSGHTFYQLHLLFDKHYKEQNELVDSIAERIQLLGGISIAMAHDVAAIAWWSSRKSGEVLLHSNLTY